MSNVPLLDYATPRPRGRRRRDTSFARPLTPRAVHHRRRRSWVSIVVAHVLASYAVVTAGIVTDALHGESLAAAPGVLLWLASPLVAPLSLAGQFGAGLSAQALLWLAGYAAVFAAVIHRWRRAGRGAWRARRRTE